MRRMWMLIVMVGVLAVACTAGGNSPARAPTSTAAETLPQRTTVPSTATTRPSPTTRAIPTNGPPTQSSASSITIVPTEPAQPSGSAEIALEPIVQGGLTRPTYLTNAGDDRLFVVEQPGRIRIVQNGQLLDQPFLNIIDKVTTAGNEQGLLGVAFHPAYKTNGQFFIYYTRQPDGAIVIERYSVSKDDANAADASSAKTILVIPHAQATNHDGGQLQFGPDGYLYIGVGDGGGQGDQHGPIGNGQNRNVLLGKLLRIDVTGQDTYAIPPTNPFGNEIWAYGLRNPWRFSFDRATNDLYIADVGQDTYEEIDVQPASSKGGENYGWRIMEGLHCYDPSEGCDQSGLVLPVAEYSHDVGGCAIIGGYVYHGSKYPALQGAYFFGDYCTGYIWSLQREGDQWQMTKRLESGLLISSFGEDVNGEVYVIDQKGAVYQLSAR
jgi:glucose/arabinose dehydrogenase